MKNVIKLILVLTLILGLCLSSCGAPKGTQQPEPGQPAESQTESQPEDQQENQLAEQKRFEDFLQRDFIDDVTADALSLHMTLRNPENYGITDYEVSWGDSMEYAPTEESRDDAQKWIEEFNSFDRALLTQDQQESYDIYSYYVEQYDPESELYYYANIFQGNHGTQYYIPIVMSEYQFTRKQDVDNYLTLCSQIGQMFDAQIQYEKIKSEKGLFMSDKLADDAIQGCKDFISKKKNNIMLLSFVERLDDVDFLTDAEKEEYISQNEEIFYDVVIPAYETVIAELGSLKGTGKNEKGLAHFEKGKEYYKSKLTSMGISRTPEELIDIYEEMIIGVSIEAYMLMMNKPGLEEMLESQFIPDLSVDEAVKYLQEKTAADFPTLPKETSYAVKIVDDSLKDFAPGFYLTPQLDYYQENVIYYSPDFADDSEMMFFLLAHEGFPGHMLQLVNLFSGPMSDFRKNCFFKSYNEGWAQYVEVYSYKYASDDEDLVRLKQLDQEYMIAIQSRWDLGVNYEGWDVKDLGDYMKDLTGNEIPKDILEDVFFSLIKNPMEIIPYSAGKYEIGLMKERYQTELGSDYSDKLFHEEFLKRGAAPFILIEKWMDEALLKKTEAPPETKQDSKDNKESSDDGKKQDTKAEVKLG